MSKKLDYIIPKTGRLRRFIKKTDKWTHNADTQCLYKRCFCIDTSRLLLVSANPKKILTKM